MGKEEKYYSIGDMSVMCNVPIKTLRYYDEIGLLEPTYRNTENKYRYYLEDQMLTLYIIRKLKGFGFSLEEIKKLVYSSDVKILRESLSDKLESISKEIELMKNQYVEVSFLLERLNQSNDFLNCFHHDQELSSDLLKDTDTIRVEEIPLSNCVFTRRIEKNYQNAYVSIGRWFEIFDLVTKQKMTPIGAITLTYHNNPLEQFFKNDCDLEVSVSVYGGQNSSYFKTFGGFEAVTAMHMGSHSKIIDTHIKAIKWINQNNYEIDGLISEEFIISPIDVKNENEYLTKIVIPVKKLAH